VLGMMQMDERYLRYLIYWRGANIITETPAKQIPAPIQSYKSGVPHLHIRKDSSIAAYTLYGNVRNVVITTLLRQGYSSENTPISGFLFLNNSQIRSPSTNFGNSNKYKKYNCIGTSLEGKNRLWYRGHR